MPRLENPDALLLEAQACLAQNRSEEALELIRRSLAARPGHAGALLQLGKALAQLRRDGQAVRAFQDALLWDERLAEAWYGLGEGQHRLEDFEAAENSFRKLLALQPGHLLGKLSLGLTLKQSGDAGQAGKIFAEGLAEAGDALMQAAFAYNLGLTQHEQGRQEAALASFTLVAKLDAERGAGDLARAALLEEMQQPEEASRLLEDVIRREPMNQAAHAAYNDFLYRQERDQEFLASYDRAPPVAALQLGKAGFLLKTGRVAEAQDLYAVVAVHEPGNLEAVLGRAAALNRLDRAGEALDLLEQALVREPENIPLYHQLALTALALREGGRAAAAAEKAVGLAPLDQYGLALQGSAWRMLGDARDEALNGYDDLIALFDLEAPEGFSGMAQFNSQLEAWLGEFNRGRRAPLNQTLRGGSQTSGHLFQGGHELVEKLKQRIAAAVDAFAAGLKADARHPFRGRRGRGVRFTGSWSSRLADCGFHVNHVHPEGWISSCYYVGVPEAVKDEGEKQGWIKFGEPSFEAGLLPRRFIQPVPGRLVLFPSYMWHGTIPFHDKSPRTTVAFDAVPVGR